MPSTPFSDNIYKQYYPGWDRAGANADWNAVGHNRVDSGGSYDVPKVPSIDEYISAIVATLPAPPPKYTEVNPFWFDEKNAEDMATAEYSPYYDELLQDYMTDVDTTKKRLGNDTTKILSELDSQKDYFVQKEGTNLERTIRGIKEGYEGSGLYFSGNRNRDVKETQADYQTGMEDYMRQHKFQDTGYETDLQRQLEDKSLAANRYTRDIGREKQTAIAGQVGQYKQEAIDEYLIGADKYYSQPNWSSMI